MSKTFDHTVPTQNQALRYSNLRSALEFLEAELAANVPPGCEKALAMTKLEEVGMWANKGISRGDSVFNG